MSRVAAFFDLDLTLIDVNSGILWAKHERSLGNISRFQLARAVFWHGMYRLALINMEVAFERAISHYKGTATDHLDKRTRDWFASEIEHRIRPAAKESLEEYRESGHPLVLLTNSSNYQANIACERWGLDAFLANSFPTDENDELTGTFERPLCYGPGKVERARRWAAANDVDVESSFFYTDSYSDLPMLEAVAAPRIVCPDPRLRRAAQKRNWPILDW